MLKQPEIQKIKYIQALPFNHRQTIAFTQTSSLIDEKNKPASTTFYKMVEVISLGQNKYCLTCLESYFTDVRQPDPSQKLQLLILEVFDLLVISTNSNGTIVQINNWEYLQKTWQTLRVEIVQDHDDQEYIKRICDMDMLMQNSDNVIKYLSLPSNYGLYFNSYKNLNLSQPTHSATVEYGKELSNRNIEEKIHIQITETKTQQLVTFKISGSATNEQTSYTGICTYLDGQLDTCSKEIITDFLTINYSAKWVGLKKSFLQ